MGRAWRSALKGFILCGLLILGLYLAMHFGAYAIGANEARQEHAQWVSRTSALSLLQLSTLYWALVALVPPSRQMRLVHALLILGASALLLVIANTYFEWAETYCDVLPYPHEGFRISKIGECPSSQTFFTILTGTALVLVLTSLIVRIASRE